ncbi:uncharacterized protein ACNLHF_021079 [Anomaloglossus baeobatrachus]
MADGEPPEEQGAAEEGEHVPEPPVDLQPPEEEEEEEEEEYHPQGPPAGSPPDASPGSISESVSDEGDNRIPTLAEIMSSQRRILSAHRRLMARVERHAALLARYVAGQGEGSSN